MGVNDCDNEPNECTQGALPTRVNEYCSAITGVDSIHNNFNYVNHSGSAVPPNNNNATSASSILVSLRNDGTNSRPSTPPLLPTVASQAQLTLPAFTSNLLRALNEKGITSYSPSVSPQPSPPSSPVPKTSSILASLKNDTGHSLASSTSSLFSSTSSLLPESRTPSPPSTPYSTPPPSPISFMTFVLSPPPSPSGSPCFVPNCLVCAKGAPVSVLKTPTWSSIMRVVFYTLQCGFPDKMFFNLRTDVYVFMGNHWDKLCPSKDARHNWKKQIQDMLSHSKNMFESGTGVYKQNGFWRLKKPLLDPWSVVKAPFHHRTHHRSGVRTKGCQFSRLDEPPPSKRRRASPSLDLEVHVPPLSENKTLVSTFRGLKTEMANLRDHVHVMLSQGLLSSHPHPHPHPHLPSHPHLHSHPHPPSNRLPSTSHSHPSDIKWTTTQQRSVPISPSHPETYVMQVVPQPQPQPQPERVARRSNGLGKAPVVTATGMGMGTMGGGMMGAHWSALHREPPPAPTFCDNVLPPILHGSSLSPLFPSHSMHAFQPHLLQPHPYHHHDSMDD